MVAQKRCPARCQRTTVSGWTSTNARLHPGQSRRNITQSSLSETVNRGCGCLRFKTLSCCRSARFSRSRSRRDRIERMSNTNRSLNVRGMNPF
jgi:hypothetical protein